MAIEMIFSIKGPADFTLVHATLVILTSNREAIALHYHEPSDRYYSTADYNLISSELATMIKTPIPGWEVVQLL